MTPRSWDCGKRASSRWKMDEANYWEPRPAFFEKDRRRSMCRREPGWKESFERDQPTQARRLACGLGRKIMAKIVYTVGVTFSGEDLSAAWLGWLREGHISEVLAGGATDAEIVALDGTDLSFEVRYHFPSREV